MTLERQPLEVIIDQYTAEIRRGVEPSIAELAAAHPEHADELRSLLPMIRAVEAGKQTCEGSIDSRPLLDASVPQSLGDFELLREIGRGGMGIVYEARQRSLDRIVALKLMPAALANHPQRRARFEREARAAARLHHTNIVPVFGVGSFDDHHYFVMQRIEGIGLDTLITRLRSVLTDPADARADLSLRHLASEVALHVSDSPQPDRAPTTPTSRAARSTPNATTHATTHLNMDDAARNESHRPASPPSVTPSVSAGLPRDATYWRSIATLMAQAADALAYAHRSGVMHRDIKPSNLLLDLDGALWITDFGLARLTDTDEADDALTQAGDLLGTLRYMSPEQFDGTFDQRSDQYSLGITLYELASLRPAFAATSRGALIDTIRTGQLATPRSILPLMPRDLETILLRATAVDPAARYPSMDHLARDLERFVEDRPIQARRQNPIERTARWARRHRTLATSLGVSLILMVAIAVTSTVAYLNVSAANTRSNAALALADAQRSRAVETASLAAEVLDTLFDRLAPTEQFRTAVDPFITTARGAEASADLPEERTDSDASPADVSGDAERVRLTLVAPTPVSRAQADLLAEILPFYERVAATSGDATEVLQRSAEAAERVGHIHEQLGNPGAAADAFALALEHVAGDSEREQRLREAQLHNHRGRVLLTDNRPDEARAALAQAADILERACDLARPASTEAACLERARTHYLAALPTGVATLRPNAGPHTMRSREDRSGRRASRQGSRRSTASPGPMHRLLRPSPPTTQIDVDELAKAIEVLDAVARDTAEASPRARHLLARCLLALPAPRLPYLLAQPPERRARDLLSELMREFPEVPTFRADYATALLKQRGPARPAAVAESLQHLRALRATHPDNVAFQLALAEALLSDAELASPSGRRAHVEQRCTEALALYQDLRDTHPDQFGFAIAALQAQLDAHRMLRRARSDDASIALLREVDRALNSFPSEWRDLPEARQLQRRYRSVRDFHERGVRRERGSARPRRR